MVDKPGPESPREFGGLLLDVTKYVVTWTTQTVDAYIRFVWRSRWFFIAGLVFIFLCLLVGSRAEYAWLVKVAVVLAGAMALCALILMAPAAILVSIVGTSVTDDRLKARPFLLKIILYFRVLGGVLLWTLLLALYFSIVPISRKPEAIPVVILVLSTLALFWVVYGIGPNIRRLRNSVVVVFLIATIGFFFPKSFAAVSALHGRLDEGIGRRLDSRGIDERAGTTISVDFRSEPEGADVFLNWISIGRTPVRWEGTRCTGVLVIFKDGYRAERRQVDYAESSKVHVQLSPQIAYPPNRILLVSENEVAQDAMRDLSTRLSQQGFTVRQPDATNGFRAHASQSGKGNIENPAFRAWVRSEYEATRVVLATVKQSSKDLGDQDFGLTGVADVMKGTTKTAAEVSLRVIDLLTGEEMATAQGTGSSLAIDKEKAAHVALTQAISISVSSLRRRLL